jgi:hypothetical protein
MSTLDELDTVLKLRPFRICSSQCELMESKTNFRTVSISSGLVIVVLAYYSLHAWKSHNLSTRCVRTACSQLPTSLEQVAIIL